MNYELLADVAQVIMGQSPPSSTYNTVGEGLPFYQGKTDFGNMYPTPRVYCTEPSRIAEAGDILISVRAPVGPTNVSQERSCIGRGISAIRVGKNLDRDFLLYFLRFYEPELAKAGTGSTFAAIAREDLETIKIPLPPLTEQKRIASLLARADRLRQLRRTAHDLGDALLQSVFLEMFGDPVTNSKKLNVEKLEGFTSLVSSGSTPLGGSNVYTASGIRFIRSQNVLMNKFDFSDIAFISEEIYASMKRTVVKPNDVLLNITGASIGRVACYKDDILANVNQHVCIIRCKPEKLNPIYLSYFLSMPSFQEKFITNQSGATRQALNFEQIKDFNISVPPLSLQEEFAGVVARVESLRGRMGESERQVEGLFESLLAESFE